MFGKKSSPDLWGSYRYFSQTSGITLPPTHFAALGVDELSPLTTKSFMTLIDEMGGDAMLTKRRLSKMSSLVLPVVLILKDDQAAVLIELDHERGDAIIFNDGDPEKREHVTISDLQERYTGQAVFIRLLPTRKGAAGEETPEELGTNWFWSVIRENKSLYVHVGIATFLTNIFVLAIPLFLMSVFDSVLPNFAYDTLWVLFIGLFVILIFDFITRSMRDYLVDHAGSRADLILGRKLFEKMMHIVISHRPASTGLVADYFKEFESLHDFYTSASIIAIIDLPFALLFLLLIAYMGGPLVIIPLIGFPLMMLMMVLLEIPNNRSVEEDLKTNQQKQALLTEALTGLESIKVLAAEPEMVRRWERSIETSARFASKSRFYRSLTMNMTNLLQQLVVVGVVMHGIYLIEQGLISVGVLFAIVILVTRALKMGQIVAIFNRFSRARFALQQLSKIMVLPTEREPNKPYLRRPELTGAIRLEHVSFVHHNARVKALHDINLTIQPKEKIGIIGPIGAGKSTLLKLIIGLYTPTEGAVYFDDTDYTEMDLLDLRRQVHYLSTHHTLFNMSLRENLLLANPSVDDNKLQEAITIAGVDTFTKKHYQGLDMPVGEHGYLISSGQRKIISIAEAIVSGASIMLLDEPTSNVDQATELKLIQSLKPAFADKTILIATHRAPMLDLVDRLIVVDQGKIVADGPKLEILQKLKDNQGSSAT